MKEVGNSSRVRLFVMLIVMILCLIGLIYRISYIKYVYGSEYEKKVLSQRHNYDYDIPALRGAILDRNSNVLAMSKRVYNVIYDVPIILKSKQDVRKQTIEYVSEELKLEKSLLEGYLETDKDNHYKIIKYGIPMELGKKIDKEIKIGKISGIWLEEDAERNYLYNELGAQVIGFYGNNEGHWGIEEKYNEFLQGKKGRKFIVYGDSSFGTEEYVEPKNGDTLVLSIDQIIQQYVEKTLLKYAEQQEVKKATAIVMNPQTGEILAMANYPTFDLNNPMKVVGDSSYDKLNNSQKYSAIQSIWRNSAISDTYEPGSTFKPLLVAAALEENIITNEDKFICNGYVNVYGTIIHCWKRSGHGEQTLEQTLANSCNMAMIEIAEKLGKSSFVDYQKYFGIGQNTNIDLLGEASAQNLMYDKDQIGPVELATSSFGQSFNVTPIQMISSFSAVINGGNVLEPYIVKQIINDDNRVTYEKETTILRKVISKETSDLVKQYLRAVVNEGTAKKAKIKGYDIGGKTGTAQKVEKGKRVDDKYVVSFVGAVPMDNPQVSILFLLDEPKDNSAGSGLTVQASEEILEKILPYMGIYPNFNDR